jgi:glutaredoxin
LPTWYTLYTRKSPPCSWCQKARELLQVYGLDYYEIDIEEDGVKEMFSEKGFRTVPQVFKEKSHIGGYNALENLLHNEQKQKEEEYRRKHGSGDSE